MIVEEAVSDEEIVGLVAGAGHRGRDVGPEEQVREECAEEDPDAGARERDLVALEPAPERADEDRRLDADEEREPGPDQEPPPAVGTEKRESGAQHEHQAQAELVGEEESAERPPRIPARQESVRQGKQDVARGNPEREQPRPGVRIRAMAVQPGREGTGRVAGPPPELPQRDPRDERRGAAGQQRRRGAGRAHHGANRQARAAFRGRVTAMSLLGSCWTAGRRRVRALAPERLAPERRRQDTVGVPERQPPRAASGGVRAHAKSLGRRGPGC